MSTIIDVAKKANVSKQTVSRVINNSSSVNENTRIKVLEAIKELKYHPNYMARVLKSKQSKSVGFIISDSENIFYTRIANALQNLLNQDGYSLFVLYSDEDSKNLEKGFEYMYEKCVDVILFTPPVDSTTIANKLKHQGVKAIQLFRKIIPDIPAIIADDEQGAFIATKELIENGHKKISMFVGPYESENRRKNGYEKAFREFGLSFDENFCVVLSGDKSSQVKEAQKHIELYKPSAIISVSSPIEYITIKALNLSQKQIKDDISLLCYDDNDLTQLFDITTIGHNIQEICTVIKSSIFNDIKEDVLVTPYLNKRKSIKKVD